MTTPMTVARTAWLDWFDDGSGESAVLVDDQVLVLSALATALVGAVHGGATSLTSIAGALESQFGTPPGGDLMAMTHAAVDALVESGVLTRAGGRTG